MRPRIKICGITRKEDALAIASMGVDALGFIFVEKSPRHVPPDQAAEIVASLPPFVTTVGVFVNPSAELVNEVAGACRLDLVQLHGEEPPTLCSSIYRRCMKAIRVRDASDLAMIDKYRGLVSGFLLDTWSREAHGGTGKTFDWRLAAEAVQMADAPVVLAGGLNPANVVEAVKQVRPWGVDLNSGVEKAPGIKDATLVKEAIDRLERIIF